MKYKIEFSGRAEILFAVMAKLLPDELNVRVEEISEAQPAKMQSHIAQLVAKGQKKLPEPKRKYTKQPPIPVNLNKGVSGIIMGLMSDGKPHRSVELKPLMKQAGFAPSGAGSKLGRLKEQGILFQPESGFWQLSGEYQKKSA